MQSRHFLQARCGAIIIEFALLAPLIIFFMLGCIDFGMYFLRAQVTAMSIQNVTTAIQYNPRAKDLPDFAGLQGLGLIDFNKSDATLCFRAYPTFEEAIAQHCKPLQRKSTPPSGATNGVYFVKIEAKLERPTPIYLASLVLPPLHYVQIIKVLR